MAGKLLIHRLAGCGVILSLCLTTGCVERRMTIRSSPPGALVYVDGYEVGITPISTSFLYYGNREIRLVKDGYETLVVKQPMPTPWYEIPGVDFISENLVPGKLHDQRTYDYQLRPQTVVPTDQLLGRAEALRRGTQATAASAPVAAGFRVNPPPRGPGPFVPPASPGVSPAAPPPVGGLPTYPLPPPGPAPGQ